MAVVAALLVGASFVSLPVGSVAAQDHEHDEEQDGGHEQDDLRPMVFVHGFMGSGAQFESQALRFVSNGYPADYIEMFEHNSLEWPGDEDYQESVWSQLDQQIDDLLAATGASQVNLLGHSQGTAFSLGYLSSSPERAAKVAQYVNLDGSHGSAALEDVETLAIWGETLTDASRELTGATNVVFEDQAHTQVVNSPETFAEIYRFFTGEDPTYEHVVREAGDEVEIGGRVQLFPENVGAEGATLSIYEIEPETGHRVSDEPEDTYDLNGNGDWGPFKADSSKLYEFAITRPDTETEHHIYTQPFVRSNPWVRLLTSEPGGLADSFWEFSDDHANMVVLRNKEWWGDQGGDSDVLEVNGESVLNDATSPRENRTIGVFVHDDGLDQESDLSEAVNPIGLPFLTGVNLYVPAASPPDGTVTVAATPRLGLETETFCVPNWASTNDRLTLQYSAYHHILNPDGTQAGGHPSPDCVPPVDRPGDTPPADGPGVAPPAPPVTGDPGFTG